MKKIDNINEDSFNKLLVKFLIDEPFFSTIIRSMRKVMTKDIPTAGVSFDKDSIVLYWNPDFVNSLSVKKIFGLLKHECYHLIFQHLTSRKQEPHLLWNIATDLAINSTLDEKELPEGGLIPGKAFESIKTKKSMLTKKMETSAKTLSEFIKSLPRNKSSEWYMEKIKNNKEITKSIENLYQGKPGKPSGSKEESTGSSPGFDHHFENSDMNEAEKALVDGKVKKIVKEAAEKADRTNSWGSMSIEMKDRIRSLLNQMIDWKSVLHYFCGTKQRANKTRSFKRINRKYPYIHPGRKIKHTSNIAIYIDQSGSVSESEIVLFFGALGQLSKNVTFTVYHFDTSVDENSKYIWRKNQLFRNPYRTRSGGTCFDSVETHFRKFASDYDGYIIMTDGCASKPKTCISKRCWVLLPGQKLYFENDKRDTVVLMKQEE